MSHEAVIDEFVRRLAARTNTPPHLLLPEVEEAAKAAHLAQCEAEGVEPWPWDDLPAWVRQAWRREVRS